VPLDAITQTNALGHSQSQYDDKSMMEMSERCLLRLKRMLSMLKYQQRTLEAGQTLFIEATKE
jgi:hypothetical protein